MAKRVFYGNVPKTVKSKTYYYMKKYNVSLADAFREAIRMTALPRNCECLKAFYADDFRRFIPSEYREEFLDFEKYPLRYEI